MLQYMYFYTPYLFYLIMEDFITAFTHLPFHSRAEDEGEDIVDSDFSIDENDEPVSDNEEEGKKKKRRLVTKAYKVCCI